MRRGTRPFVLDSLLDKPGSNRIQADVTHRSVQMNAIERRLKEAVLPQVTAAYHLSIKVDGVVIVGPAQRTGE